MSLPRDSVSVNEIYIFNVGIISIAFRYFRANFSSASLFLSSKLRKWNTSFPRVCLILFLISYRFHLWMLNVLFEKFCVSMNKMHSQRWDNFNLVSRYFVYFFTLPCLHTSSMLRNRNDSRQTSFPFYFSLFLSFFFLNAKSNIFSINEMSKYQ